MSRWLVPWLGAWLGLWVGCSHALPRPPTSDHTPEELVEVPYPPPAVRADVVPARPHPTSVWVDGEWHWEGNRWVWRRGTWLVAPEGATLAAWETRRDGARVLHAESVFHLAEGGSVLPTDLREGRRRPPSDAICASAPPAVLPAPAASASASP